MVGEIFAVDSLHIVFIYLSGKFSIVCIPVQVNIDKYILEIDDVLVYGSAILEFTIAKVRIRKWARDFDVDPFVDLCDNNRSCNRLLAVFDSGVF